MGGFLAGGDKYWREAEGINSANHMLSEEIQFAQGNRQLLQQIRQARLAASRDEYMTDQTTGEYIQVSGAPAATANIYSTLAGAYGYSVDQSLRIERLQAGQTFQDLLENKAIKRDKRAVQNAKLVSAHLQTAGAAVGAVIGGMMGGPAGAMIGAEVGQQAGGALTQPTIGALHGGKAARKYGQHQTAKAMFNMTQLGIKKMMSNTEGEGEAPFNTEEFAQTVGRKPDPNKVSDNNYLNKLTSAQSSSGGFFSMLSNFSFGG